MAGADSVDGYNYYITNDSDEEDQFIDR